MAILRFWPRLVFVLLFGFCLPGSEIDLAGAAAEIPEMPVF